MAQRHSPTARPIMVVEDNPMNLDFMLQAFEEHSISNPVHICRDGEEALEFIEAHQTPGDPNLPLLVLLDCVCPRWTASKSCARLGSIRFGNKSLLSLSPLRARTRTSRAYEMGANSYIVKPLDFASFSEVVKPIMVY